MFRRVKFALVGLFVIGVVVCINEAKGPVIPKTWDDDLIKSASLPIVGLDSLEHLASDFYYRVPVRPIYKSYPIYAPGKEPPGYMERLRQQEPEEIKFDTARYRQQDWIKAGEMVFEAPNYYDTIMNEQDVRDSDWYQRTGMPVTKDGIMPFGRYVIRQKGKVEVGNLSCMQCHVRVMPDGTAINGAQSSYPFDRADAAAIRRQYADHVKRSRGDYFITRVRAFGAALWAAPWVDPDPRVPTDTLPLQEIIAIRESVPAGVMSRMGTSIHIPVKMPQLVGVKDVRYLDMTGIIQHRSVGDIMRYAAFVQGGDDLTRYGNFIPWDMFGEKDPPPDAMERYSDEQLYALALYLYSLKLPPNPNKFDAAARQGKNIFEREGCITCHTPPLYTNNKLTPAEGFTPPPDHLKKYDVLPISVGTDSRLALRTRRGTGYYKVPSLRGVWARGPFEHGGSVAKLEDWFDPRRVRDDYVPTGFVGYQVKSRAVKGHPFGLNLSESDRRALIAFLRTL